MSITTKEPSRLRDLKVGVTDLVTLDPSVIVVEDGHNPRNYNLPENRAHLDELKGSIKENGVQMPLAVRWDPETKRPILVDGECRLRAVLELIEEGEEIKGVPTFQVKCGNEAERLKMAITANTGKPLSKWEIGSAFQRLKNFGWSDEEIAKKTGYSLRFISESMELSDAPEEVKSLLSQRAITPSLALDHVRKSGSGSIITLRSAVVAAQSKRKGTKTVTAKRARVTKGITLNSEETKAVNEALQEAAIQKDKKCGELGEAALAIFAAKGVK